MTIGLDPISKATAEEKRLRRKDAIEGLLFLCVKTDVNDVSTLYKPTQSKGGHLIHNAGSRRVENAAYNEAIDDVRKFIYKRFHHYLGRASDLHAEHFTDLVVKSPFSSLNPPSTQ